jgi:hypothetical protein
MKYARPCIQTRPGRGRSDAAEEFRFVSGYRRGDGVGPRERRPKRLDLAWHSLKTNEVGRHELARRSECVRTELMLTLNLGTRSTLEALDLLECTNIRAGSALAEQRAANGSPDPFNVRMWCLGNEMDGPWQLGHRSAEDYGKIASQVAKAMRQMDPGARARRLRQLCRGVADGRGGVGTPGPRAHLRGRRLHLLPRLPPGA